MACVFSFIFIVKLRGLLYAAVLGHEAVVKVLIAAGADVNKAAPFRGRTPLWAAAYCDHEAVVKVLIAAGAEVCKGSSV